MHEDAWFAWANEITRRHQYTANYQSALRVVILHAAPPVSVDDDVQQRATCVSVSRNENREVCFISDPDMVGASDPVPDLHQKKSDGAEVLVAGVMRTSDPLVGVGPASGVRLY